MKHFYSCLLLLISSVCFSQSQKELYNQSVEAYKSKNYNAFLAITKKLDSLRPSHPTYTYNLAVAFALNHQNENAIAVLEKAVLMNNKVAFEEDADFQSLKITPYYQRLLRLKADMNKTIIGSSKVISLNEKDLHPEGLLYLPKSKTWLVSSIRNRKIVTFDIQTGQCKDWLTDNEMLSVFAMKADVKAHYLWVSTASMPEMKGFTKDLEGKAEVLKIDIKKKTIVSRFPISGNHVLGDLVISKNGDVYVSDSGEAVIYKIENNQMAVWLDLKKEGFNLQGLTFNPDESKLFIADYLKGILVVPMKNPSDRKWLAFPKGTTVKGIDGLVYHKNTLIAVHNGVKPIRIIQYQLNDNQDQIIKHNVIDNNRPELDEPALATIVNGKLFFFANSPWTAYDKDFNLDLNKFETPMLFRYDLK